MNIDKYDINYLEYTSQNKPVFIFVNHKTAVICWAKIKNKIGKKTNVVTFDSHGDFKGGVFNGEDPKDRESYFGSKYIPEFKHFTKCQAFSDWDILDIEKTNKFIRLEKKFLFINNDNFIDIAFMKDIVGDVYWYYLNLEGNTESGKCDDFNSKDHFFIREEAKNFKYPTSPFILDIDLDFFVKTPEFTTNLISKTTIRKYLKLQKELFSNKLCMGLTIALEPNCCGGEASCLKILRELCKEFKLDIFDKSKELIYKF